MLTLFLPALKSENAYLEESYFFTEAQTEFGSFLHTAKKLQLSIRKTKSHLSHTDDNKLISTSWSEATLDAALHRLDIIQHEIKNTLLSFSNRPWPKKAHLRRAKRAIRKMITSNYRKRNKRDVSKHYAPLEFLGDLESFITGQPSASQFRQVIEFSNQLAANGQSQGKLLHGIANVQHEFSAIINNLAKSDSLQNELLQNITLALTSDNIKSHSEAELTRHILALISCTDTAILQGQNLHHQIWTTLIAGEAGLLSRRTIPPTKLSALINKNRNPSLSPPPSIKHAYFYSNKLTHVLQSNHSISSITRIPLINKNAPYSSEITSLSEKEHPLHFRRILTSKIDLGFRYLTADDIKSCTKTKNTLICHKRRISIEPQHRGHIFVHDINLMTILIHQNASTNVQIICPQTHSNITLPKIANITLHPSCELISFNAFRVWKLEKMPLVRFITPSSNISDLTSELEFLSHQAKLNNTRAISSFQTTLTTFKKALLNDVTLKFNISQHLESVHSKITSNDNKLHKLDQDQQNISSSLDIHSSMHDYLILGAGVVVLFIISLQIWMLKKRINTSEKPTTVNNISTAAASPAPSTVTASDYAILIKRVTNLESVFELSNADIVSAK